jgi:hypothetical protein
MFRRIEEFAANECLAGVKRIRLSRTNARENLS